MNAEQKKTGYISKRQNFIYYTYIDMLMRGLAADAKSLLDVGSNNAEYLEAFDWIEERYALDIQTVYSSPNVKGIKANFLTFDPGRRFDFVTCFQVLEHIQDASTFAKRLTTMSDRVLISVPFRWPVNSHWDHKHDMVQLDTVTGWFGRKPDYSLVVQEPLIGVKKSRRLIAYYHGADKMPPFKALRQAMAGRMIL